MEIGCQETDRMLATTGQNKTTDTDFSKTQFQAYLSVTGPKGTCVSICRRTTFFHFGSLKQGFQYLTGLVLKSSEVILSSVVALLDR